MKLKGLKRQGSLFAMAAVGALIAGAIALPNLWPQTTCTQTSRVFSENFNTLNFKDAANSSVEGWTAAARGPITLPVLGSNFAVANAGSMGGHIYVSAAGDFTGDGYPDLIGLEIGGQVASTAPYSRLVLVRNRYTTNPDQPLWIDWTEVYDSFGTTYTGPACITVGDYNGDGLLDFFFMRNSTDQFGYTNFLAKMYINIGTATDPNFTASSTLNLDFSSSLRVTVGSGKSAQTFYVYNYWAANHLATVDIDKDGDIDILMISEDKIFCCARAAARGVWPSSRSRSSTTAVPPDGRATPACRAAPRSRRPTSTATATSTSSAARSATRTTSSSTRTTARTPSPGAPSPSPTRPATASSPSWPATSPTTAARHLRGHGRRLPRHARRSRPASGSCATRPVNYAIDWTFAASTPASPRRPIPTISTSAPISTSTTTGTSTSSSPTPTTPATIT